MKKIYISSILIVTVLVFAGTKIVKANPSYFYQSTGNATTTVTYMSAGTATTTATLDSYTGTFQTFDSAALAVLFTGSSTASVINIAIERSQDGNDWFADTYTLGASSSPSSVGLNTINSFSLTFASTTVGGAGGTSATITRIIDVPTPTRYTRSVITVPAGSPKGAVFQKWIAKRQTAY